MIEEARKVITKKAGFTDVENPAMETVKFTLQIESFYKSKKRE